jgi:glycosyltransferase involved in cell wall biosynthesis
MASPNDASERNSAQSFAAAQPNGPPSAANGSALGDLLEELQRLRAAIREQRAEVTHARRLLAAEREPYVERQAALRDDIEAGRARIEEFLTTSPRLAHLTPFRQAFTLYSRCAALREEISADAYIAHDDIPLLAAHRLEQLCGGSVVYDAAEFPDRRERFGQFQHVWPRPTLDLMVTYLAPIIRSCRFALTGGEPIADHIRATFGIPAHTIYNARKDVFDGVDPTIRARCGVGPNEVLMLYVNTVGRASLFENLVDGLAQLDRRHHLAVLGNIAPMAPELKDELEERARQRGVADRLHFLGVAPYEEMPRIASGADCAIVAVDPTIKNGSMFVHNRYFDALAAGLPVLSSLNVGARQVFEGQPFYREFDLLCPDDFAATVATTDLKSIRRERVRAFARDWTWSREVPKLVDLFGFASTVTILTVKDVARHQRTRQFAETLAETGIGVNIVCRRSPDAAEPEIPGVNWHRVERIY